MGNTNQGAKTEDEKAKEEAEYAAKVEAALKAAANVAGKTHASRK